MQSNRLHSLLLFLMFKDHYAEKTHSFNSDATLLILGASFATLELVLAGFFFYLMQISMILTVLVFIAFVYGLLQLLHIYDYWRARN